MPRPTQKTTSKTAHMFDDRVVRLTKTVSKPPQPRPMSGVSSSVLYDEESGVLKVLKFPKGFGKAVKTAREKMGMSQKDLATKLSKPSHVVLSIEKDEGVFDKLLFQRLEKTLQTQFDPLFSRGK
ncbi:putative transcription factor [Nematocida minor]|uniref:putative transcription factor n=1 Tax=Nematocida minor TaxID=1912983 RepID=UPI00221ED9F3|nr:putative transcription factor [Nematocida minor]KAI5189651.1 putative transcription factor [Nematocida minor]